MKEGTEAGAIPAKVSENSTYVDRGVGEAGRAGEEVGGADVGTDRGRRQGAASSARQREDHQQQPERRDHLGEEVGRRSAVMGRDRDCRQREHRVRADGAGDAAGGLSGDVGEGVAPA